ncbi:MAG TPA: hypothetical protein VFY71_17090 [Planctomycetota bacterium]|nr:hypothetical protein [Planctomycetota bacterium]
MKLATACACLALIAWHPGAVPLRVAGGLGPLDATVTHDGQVVTVSVGAPRTLRISAQREAGLQTFDLDLAALPEDARVVAAQLGAFGDHGLAAALAIETAAGTEYRWLYTFGDPLQGRLLAPGPDARPSPETIDDWTLSGPLFTSTGTPYRLVDIHNPGGDSLELTFRRGELQGVRSSSGEYALDERVVHDVCPMGFRLGMRSTGVAVSVERVVAVK